MKRNNYSSTIRTKEFDAFACQNKTFAEKTEHGLKQYVESKMYRFLPITLFCSSTIAKLKGKAHTQHNFVSFTK